jgi:integrase
VPNLRLHDFRRTAASLMTGMGISRLTVKKILNHAERDVTAIYDDRHSYDPEKRTALEAWGRRLDAIVTGAAGKGHVVALSAQAAPVVS